MKCVHGIELIRYRGDALQTRRLEAWLETVIIAIGNIMIPHHKLPIGIQTFREIRENHYYYVDKTGLAVDLVERGKYYFLSRPRRFGKSLLIDTFKELFEGQEPLFRGLAAHERLDWSVQYPVLKLSFGGGVTTDRAQLDRRLTNWLRTTFEAHQLNCTMLDTADGFAELIRHLYEQTGQRVVILVDEYDKPILDRLDQPEIAMAIREGLKDFYSVIKEIGRASCRERV